MTDLGKAVFLSYASEDAAAALRICTALRDAGVEVWFDQSELRGGDAWDAAIRQQIRSCALFIPVISRNTHAREEGYFRLEWKIAVDRSHLMTAQKTFLVPVVIDDTRDSDPHVPDRFREVQWTRLTDGTTPPAFVERVARLLSHEPASTVLASDTAVGVLRAPATAPGRAKAIWGLIALAALAAVGYFALHRRDTQENATPPPVPAVAAPRAAAALAGAIPEKSIAVMPFINLSPDKEQDYFSDGLSEELIDQLSKIPDLRVPARSSSFYFKGKNEDIATVAQKLRVAHLLEGSVRKSGNRLRVTAELIRADNGYHVWSETYDRELKDVFKVQDEIAGAVVAALKLKLAPEQTAVPQRTANTEAYNEYLLGRQFISLGTPAGNLRAIGALQKAVKLDPTFASAYAQLAITQAYEADDRADSAAQKQAQLWAGRAVELNPQGADGYAVRGYLRYNFVWDMAGAQADFSKALELDPGDSMVLRRYSQLLSSLGRLPEAIVEARKSADADPLNSAAWQSLGQLLLGAGDLSAARAANARALEIAPDDTFAMADLGTLYLLEGHPAEALAAFERIDVPTFQLMGVAQAEHSLGRAQQSQQALDKLVATLSGSAAYQIAAVYAWRGEKEQAFAWLDRAYRQHDGGLTNLPFDPAFASVRSDPRIGALLRKMNLA